MIGDFKEFIEQGYGGPGTYVANCLSRLGLKFYVVNGQAAKFANEAGSTELQKLEKFVNATRDGSPDDIDIDIFYRIGQTANQDGQPLPNTVYPFGSDDHRAAIVDGQLVLSRDHLDLIENKRDNYAPAIDHLVRSAVEAQLSLSQDPGDPARDNFHWMTNGFGDPSLQIGQDLDTNPTVVASICFFQLWHSQPSEAQRARGFLPNSPIFEVTPVDGTLPTSRTTNSWENIKNSFDVAAHHEANFSPSEWTNIALLILKSMHNRLLTPSDRQEIDDNKYLEILQGRVAELAESFGGRYEYKGMTHENNFNFIDIRRRSLNLLKYIPRLLAVDPVSSLNMLDQTGMLDLFFGSDNGIYQPDTKTIDFEILAKNLQSSDYGLTKIKYQSKFTERAEIVMSEWRRALSDQDAITVLNIDARTESVNQGFEQIDNLGKLLDNLPEQLLGDLSIAISRLTNSCQEISQTFSGETQPWDRLLDSNNPLLADKSLVLVEKMCRSFEVNPVAAGFVLEQSGFFQLLFSQLYQYDRDHNTSSHLNISIDEFVDYIDFKSGKSLMDLLISPPLCQNYSFSPSSALGRLGRDELVNLEKLERIHRLLETTILTPKVLSQPQTI